MSDYKLYELSPKKKWSIFNICIWHNTLKNGKYVEFRYRIKHGVGSFYISLTESKKNELLEQDKILINDALSPKISFHMSSEVELGGKIINKQTYTEEEKKEIHRLLYFDIRESHKYDPNSSYILNTHILKANNWIHHSLQFYIRDGGCNIKLVPEHDDNEIKPYILIDSETNTSFSNDLWNINLKNGKNVEYEIYKIYEHIRSKVEITEKRKRILENDDNPNFANPKIILNDVSGCSVNDLIEFFSVNEKLTNEENYSKKEKQEIHRLLYFDKDDEKSYDPHCDCNVKDTILKANGWCIEENDITYGISSGGCILKKMNGFYYGNDPFSQEFI
jgi:hypothetical protein